MAAAPSYAALFNTQPQFEAAFVAYLEANGFASGSVYRSTYDGDMSDARVELVFEPGTSQGHCATPSTTHTGEKENDWFDGSISFAIQTERAKALPSPITGFDTLHDYRVSQVQALMLRGAMNGNISGITALSLPYHIIVVISKTGQADDVADDAYDRTLLSYGIQYQIKADAWPANA